MSDLYIKLNEEEEKLFRAYFQLRGKDMSELFKRALVEEIEDRLDYELAIEALKDYEADPQTIAAIDFLKELS